MGAPGGGVGGPNGGGGVGGRRPGRRCGRPICQGGSVGRPSTLFLSVGPAAAMDEERIYVGGNVVELGQGSVRL